MRNIAEPRTRDVRAGRLRKDMLLADGSVIISVAKDDRTKSDGRVRVRFFDANDSIVTKRWRSNALIRVNEI